MTTVGVGGFGKAKKTYYKGKEAVVKYVNTAGSPQATLATCTINRQDARYEGEIQKLFSTAWVAEVYAIEGHAIYMKYYPDGSLRSQIVKGGADKHRYRCAWDIIKGIKEIHRLDFVHSDIKASNVLVVKKDDYLYYVILQISVEQEKKVIGQELIPQDLPQLIFLKKLFVLKMIFSL